MSSLFGTLQLSANALQAQQIGLQVVGQNIANANTPGYSREEVLLGTASPQRLGQLVLGMGVEVLGVVQKIDKFLEERLRGATGDRASSETREGVFAQLEGLIGELGETDLSTSLNKFFASISEVLNQPESVIARNLAVLEGRSLAADFNRLAGRVTETRIEQNKRITDMAVDINRLLREIRDLNVRIVTTEAGEISRSDAVGLRDQRQVALTDLARLVNIKVEESETGAVNVFSGGDFLVYENTARQVGVVFDDDRGIEAASIHILETDSPLAASSGELAGLIAARDEVLGGFLDQLNHFAGTLAFEFNKLFSSGQGLAGYTTLTSHEAVADPDQTLDAAGLAFSPVHGAFEVQVYNDDTGLTETTVVSVDLDGLDDNGTTLASLAAQLDAIDGLTASIGSDGRLTLSVDSAGSNLAFGNDTSGVLAALGLNTFFTGSTALGLGVNQRVVDDPALFAASRDGIGTGTAGAVAMAGFIDQPLSAAGGATLKTLYEQILTGTTQGAAAAQALAEGSRVFEEALRGRQMATSGVSLDEEAIRMIMFQRAYQASARVISTISELLDILVEL